MKTGYRNSGHTNPSWDLKVERAFEAFADYSRVSTTNWPALEEALAAVTSSRCDDGMIQYMRARYPTQDRSAAVEASEFAKAHDVMLESKHHPLFKFYAGMRAVDAARAVDKKGNRSSRIMQTTSALQDLVQDTNAPIDEVFDSASLWLNHSRTKDWLEYIGNEIDPLLGRHWGTTSEQWFRYRGEAEVWLAWGERGSGWASSVTDKGWEGFKEHLAKAEELLTTAWERNPKNAKTAYLMMQVELGQGKDRKRMEMWFNRAMALETNYYDATKLMSFYLEPRWYGSADESLKFARSCAQSDQWGGQVPLILANVHHSLMKYSKLTNSTVYWQRPDVWPDIQLSYEKFFTLNPDATGWRHDYAKDAYNCGEYAVFLEQTKLFTFGTNHDFFGGQDNFEKMIATAKAASKTP